MKLEILEEKKNPMLRRKEVEAVVVFENQTPSRLEMKDAIAKKIKAKPELVIVSHIYTGFGSRKAKLEVNVYDDEDSMKKLERKNLIEKHVKKVEEVKESPKEKATEEVKKEANSETKVKEKPEAKEEEKKSE